MDDKVKRIIGDLDMESYPEDYPICFTCKKRHHKSEYSTYDMCQKDKDRVLRCDPCWASTIQKLGDQIKNAAISDDYDEPTNVDGW